MIELFKRHVLKCAYILKSFFEIRLVKKVTGLYADLGVFVGIKRRYAALCGSEGLTGKPLLLAATGGSLGRSNPTTSVLPCVVYEIILDVFCSVKYPAA